MQYRRGGLRAQFLYDDYRTTTRDAYDAILPAPLDEDFRSYLGDLSYAFTPRPGLRITPEFKAAVQQPWRNNDDPDSDVVFYEVTAQRYSGTVKANWDPCSTLNLLLGGQYEWEGADYGDRADYRFPNGKRSIDYNRRALFAEAYLKLADVNITGGVRWDDHCEYDAAFAPRLCVTRMFNNTHFKYIYNRSYKAPSIEQISSGVDVRTEEADVYEIEIGREFRPTLYGGINLFDIQLFHPLIYMSQDGTVRNFRRHRHPRRGAGRPPPRQLGRSDGPLLVLHRRRRPARELRRARRGAGRARVPGAQGRARGNAARICGADRLVIRDLDEREVCIRSHRSAVGRAGRQPAGSRGAGRCVPALRGVVHGAALGGSGSQRPLRREPRLRPTLRRHARAAAGRRPRAGAADRV